MEKVRLFDSHAHLLDKRFREDISDIIKDVNAIICVSSPNEDMVLFKELLKESHIWGAIGIHPHDAKDVDILWPGLEQALKSEKIVAIGETGLDFYYNNSPQDIQKEVFKKQISLAENTQQPLIVHTRDAFGETMDILSGNKVKKILIHCFSGSVEDMKEVIKRGYYIAVGGVVTFPKAIGVKEVVKEVPLEKLLIETDCPYLSPHPVRGRRNQPAHLKYILEEISRIKGIDSGKLGESIYKNTIEFFELQ